MGESLAGALRIVAGIVITCLLIAFAFGVWNSSKEAGNAALNDSNGTITLMQESKYTQYDGQTVTGSEVINVIKQFENDPICVEVITAGGTEVYNYAEDDFSKTLYDGDEEARREALKKAKDKTDPAYISPNVRFFASITRNDNGAITKITFDSTI